MTTEERIRNRAVGVVGMAKSGLAAALLAKNRGGVPFVSDNATLASQTTELTRAGIAYETGGHTERLLASDYLIVSPGVPLTLPILVQASNKGIPIFSELEFGSWFCQAKIVAVTGTNGKTTTTTLIGELLKAAGFDTVVCGNIGLPLSSVAEAMSANTVAVVEASSFQLETINDFRPHVSVILNITPDHLDWHGGFENYKRAKYRITENQTASDFFVSNRDDKELVADNPPTRAKKIYFSTTPGVDATIALRDNILCVKVGKQLTPVIKSNDILIPGPHNLQNAAAALGVAHCLGIREDVVAQVLRTFAGVEHRLEKVGRIAGVSFINDSKATNVDSVCYALRSVDTKIILIAGGRDKGSSYAPIIADGKGKIRNIIAIGEAKEKIFSALGKAFPVQFANTLESAVNISFEMAEPGETVLLSPGCASFDMFENFEHRGKVFKTAVSRLKNGKKKNETIAG